MTHYAACTLNRNDTAAKDRGSCRLNSAPRSDTCNASLSVSPAGPVSRRVSMMSETHKAPNGIPNLRICENRDKGFAGTLQGAAVGIEGLAGALPHGSALGWVGKQKRRLRVQVCRIAYLDGTSGG